MAEKLKAERKKQMDIDQKEMEKMTLKTADEIKKKYDAAIDQMKKDNAAAKVKAAEEALQAT